MRTGEDLPEDLSVLGLGLDSEECLDLDLGPVLTQHLVGIREAILDRLPGPLSERLNHEPVQADTLSLSEHFRGAIDRVRNADRQGVGLRHRTTSRESVSTSDSAVLSRKAEAVDHFLLLSRLQGDPVFPEDGSVKTTVDLPDDLLSDVKIEAARQRKKLEELLPDLVRAGLKVRRTPAAAGSRDMARWLEEWVEMGEAATEDLPVGPKATEILASDRGRL